MTKSPTTLLRLISFEMILSGIISAIFTAIQRYEMFLGMSLLVVFAGGFCLWVAARPLLVNKFEAAVSSRFGKIASFTPVALLGLFLFFFEPVKTALLSISPVLLSIWLIGPQLIWFSSQKLEHTLEIGLIQEKKSSLLALLFACGFLLIPSNIPSLSNGIPLDQPFEFISATLLIPIAWIVNKRFFSNKAMIKVFMALFVIKLLIWVFMPQGGLGVRVFTSPQAMSNGQWESAYTAWLNTSYSNVMQAPYKSMREFPVEWANNRSDFDFDQFWMTLEVNGTIHLYDEGRLVFLVQGAKEAQFEMADADTGIKTPAMLVDDFKTLDAGLYNQLPEYAAFDLRGTVLYAKFGEARLEPALLYSDGSVKPLFENAGVWLSQEDTLSQGRVVFFDNLLNFLASVFAAVIFLGALQGLANLHSKNQLSTVDVYLAVSSPAVYFLSSSFDKPQAPLLIIFTLAVVAGVKTLDFKFNPSQPNFKSYIVFAGTVFLLGYLTLDINNLRSIATLPPAQDGLEYQTFARNIFVGGDVFLEQTPPRAYKVLFPYVVGTLHTFFGQSTAAQFVLNAWCALLSAALTFTLARKFQLPLQTALLASISFLIILCLPSSYIYYFRFGLIEPIAILCLLATLVFALERQINKMRWMAILTVLFRLDYVGVILAAIILAYDPMIGGIKSAWSQLFGWIRENAKDIAAHILMVVSLPFLIIAGYFLFMPGYKLNAGDVKQTSLSSMLEGFMRVLVGGNFHDFQDKASQGSFEFLLILIPLAAGSIISLLSIFHRRGIFAKIDLRLALLIPAILPAYIAVRPAAYFPRFSFPILALDILLVGMFLHHLGSKMTKTSNWKSE